MFYLREIPMLQKHGGGILAGGKDMLLSKMLFEPIHWNNRNYFGSEIWDTNAPGFQQIYLLNQATPDEQKRYLPFAKRETRTQWYTEHPPQ